MSLKLKLIALLTIVLPLFVWVQQSFAVTLPLKLAWNRNTESDLAYYRVYYGTSSRNYSNFITVDKQNPSCSFDGTRLSVGQIYYIALTAIDFSLNESGYSGELVANIEPSATTTTAPPSSVIIIEAEQMSYHTNGAQDGEFWCLWANGTMNEEVYFPTTGVHRFEITVKGDLAYNVGPEMELLIDGNIKGTVFVNTTIPQTFVFNVDVPAGTHELAIGFYNDVYNPADGVDRNLYVDKTTITFATGSVSTTIPSTTSTTTVPRTTTTTTISTYRMEYCSTDDVLLLQGTIPEEGTMSVTIPDELSQAISATLYLALWDPDVYGEGYIYINGKGPVNLPVGNYDSQVHSFEININKDWLVEGENAIRFTHVATMGYEVRKACINISFSPSGDDSTTTTAPPPPPTTIPRTSTTTTPPSTSTTSVPSDTNPPTGIIVVNSGDDVTQSQLVTLDLSAEDYESGMGAGSMMSFSNDNLQWSDPEPFALTRDWVLSTGEGEKTVYAKFCDCGGNWMSEPASDSIWLEEACSEPIEFDATAIESSGDFHPLFAKEYAVDGEIYTGWLSPLKFFVEHEYLTIDLGETQMVNRIELFSYPLLLFLDLFPLDFALQASTDNETWQELFPVDNYTPPPTFTDSWAFDEQEARYVKLLITKPKPFLFFFYLSYIPEIKIYGCPEAAMATTHQPSTDGNAKIRVVKIPQFSSQLSVDSLQ